MGFVEDVGDFLLGEKSETQESKVNLAPESADELKRRQAIEGELSSMQNFARRAQRQLEGQVPKLTSKDKAIQDLFRSSVLDFLSKDKFGKITPELQEEAESFVNQTFSLPAQEQFRRFQGDLENQAARRAAIAGRTGMDSDFNQQLIDRLSQAQTDIALEGGARRAQRLDELSVNRPLQQLQGLGFGLQGVSQLQQQNAFAPMFLNQLNQQALQNRLALANAQTGILDRLRNERFARAGQTVIGTDSSTRGLLGNISAIGGGIQQIGAQFSPLGTAIKGAMGGAGGGGGTTGFSPFFGGGGGLG